MTEEHRGSTLRQVIEADKPGFLEHLDGLRETHRTMAANTDDTLRNRARERGIAEGIEIAMRAVESWVNVPAREWLYGLLADEWFHLSCEDENSEVAPCCGTLGALRDGLRELMLFQEPHLAGFREATGRQILQLVKEDDDEHGLDDKKQFPILHRVMDGIRADLTKLDAERAAMQPAAGPASSPGTEG